MWYYPYHETSLISGDIPIAITHIHRRWDLPHSALFSILNIYGRNHRASSRQQAMPPRHTKQRTIPFQSSQILSDTPFQEHELAHTDVQKITDIIHDHVAFISCENAHTKWHSGSNIARLLIIIWAGPLLVITGPILVIMHYPSTSHSHSPCPLIPSTIHALHCPWHTGPCLGYRRFSHPPLLVQRTSPADTAQKAASERAITRISNRVISSVDKIAIHAKINK